jgi:hypothetical protein
VLISVSVPFSTAETGKTIVKNTRRIQAQKTKEKGTCIGFLSFSFLSLHIDHP